MQTVVHLLINLFMPYLTTLSALLTSYLVSNIRILVNNESERMCKELVVANICIHGLRKITAKNLRITRLLAETFSHDPPNMTKNGHIAWGSVTFVQRGDTDFIHPGSAVSNSRRQTTGSCNVCTLLFVVYQNLCNSR
jgi:hypothetical protein